MEPLNKEQQLGIILERLSDTVDAVNRLEQRFNGLEARVNDKFKTAETMVKFMRFLGLGFVALLTFKFGDISRLWHHFFS